MRTAASAEAQPLEGAAGAPLAGERALLALLCAGVLAYWALQYQPFAIPNNDYYSFERVAHAFARGELPANLKRMPLLPALMALLAPLMPEPHRELHAALVLNLAFSLALLVALFELGRRTLGAGAIVPVVLVAASLEFHAMALQPLVEPSYGFFVVAAFVLLARGSPWQYAAGAGAALSRYEAALLLPVLLVANVASGAPLRRHALWASLAAAPCAVWTLLGAVRGSGGGIYLNIMKEMGFRPNPFFLLVYLKEDFAGFYSSSLAALLPLAVLVGIPCTLGLWIGWRGFRREALAIVAFLILEVLVVVSFGISKPRYAYPTDWIPLFFFGVGALACTTAASERIAARVSGGIARALALVALGVLLTSAALWTLRLAQAPRAAPMLLDLAFGALCLIVLIAFLSRAARAPRSPRAAWLAAAGAFLAVTTWMIGGGIRGKEATLLRVRDANAAAVVLAGWLEANLRPHDRMVLLPRSHVLHLTDFELGRFSLYAELEAEDVSQLAAEMRRRGLTLAAYTWRPEVRSAHSAVMYRAKKTQLEEAFRDGGPVPGFERVATLPLPARLGLPAVQVYRLVP